MMNEKVDLIDSSHYELQKVRLIKPYVLSFGTITHFHIFTVKLVIDSEIFLGEVVPLFGYNEESLESIRLFYERNIFKLKNLEIEEARTKIVNLPKGNDFAKSAILTAIDMYGRPEIAGGLDDANNGVDYVKAISLKDQLKYDRNEVIKIKLTGRPQDDINGLEHFFKINSNLNTPVRLDANQGYSLNDAQFLFNHLINSIWRDKLAYVEQPLNAMDWEGASKLAKDFKSIPIMLDESVITDEDIKRCKEIQIPFVKFKLYKQGGIQELENQIKLAHKLGLKIVLGNGVAGELTNKIENYLYKKYNSILFGASEANGFLKVTNHI